MLLSGWASYSSSYTRIGHKPRMAPRAHQAYPPSFSRPRPAALAPPRVDPMSRRNATPAVEADATLCLHRGAHGNATVFAERFIRGRLFGFEKDMRICLTGAPRTDGAGLTHAYFPALAACCSMLEYLAALHAGRLTGIGRREISAYATKYLRQPDYGPDAIRVLIDAFRNSVNHRGIATGVWIDRATPGRRVTWRIMADALGPAIELRAAPGVIRRDAPWPCPFTHRAHVHLGRLWRDIKASADRYIADIAADAGLQINFNRCMTALYPN